MSDVTLYTTPNCSGCTMTKRVLDRQGTEYDVVDLSQDEKALKTVQELGYSQAPVVVTKDAHWSGFRDDLIKRLAE